VKTGVQAIGKALKTLDSGFRRNDEKKKRTDFFTPSPVRGGGLEGEVQLEPSAPWLLEPSFLHDHPAIAVNQLAGDERTFVGGQEQGQVGDVLRRALAV